MAAIILKSPLHEIDARKKDLAELPGSHVLVTELDAEAKKECARIVDRIRQHVTENSAIAPRQVHVVDSGWILKTSSGKVTRSANKEKSLMEAGFR